MDNTPLYLRPDVVAEPLVTHWHAWTHLIAPVTAGLHVARSHLSILDSYVRHPSIHVAAQRDPAMRGGPFVQLDGAFVDQVEELRTQTERVAKRLLELAAAVEELHQILEAEADGGSLEPLYSRVPESLRGLVEFEYDVRHQASVRFIESLFYSSSFYDRSLQSLALFVAEDDVRPFALSTPRLEQPENLHLHVPFDHPGLARLFSARIQPRTIGELRESLDLHPAAEQKLRTYLTAEAPALPSSMLQRDRVRIRYFGHASVLIQSRAVSILTDPLIAYANSGTTPRYSFADLPHDIDYAVVTHTHQDHVVLESLLQLRHRIRHVVVPRSSETLPDPSLARMLRVLGFPSVIELGSMDAIEFEGGEIRALPFFGEHADVAIQAKMCPLIRIEGRSLVLAADSNNLDRRVYRRVHDQIGPVDAVFVGLECEGAPINWLYGPLLFRSLSRRLQQTRRFRGSNAERAHQMVRDLGATHAWVYAMGDEPWTRHLTSVEYDEDSLPVVEAGRFQEFCHEDGIHAERLFGRAEFTLDARKTP